MLGFLNRRNLLALFGIGIGGAAGISLAGPAAQEGPRRRIEGDLQDAMAEMPVIDVHSHAFPPFAPMTEEIFLESMALSEWMLDAYFPPENGERRSVYDKWKAASPEERRRLEKKYDIQRWFSEVVEQMRSTLFTEALVKEMAAFFKCKPTLKDVIAARNEYTSGNYWGYVNDLFAAAKLEGALVQGALSTWTMPIMDQDDFKNALDMQVYDVISAGAYDDFYDEDISFSELISKYRESMTRQVQEGGVAFKSGIVKETGADVAPVPREAAEAAWDSFRKLSAKDKQRIYDRTWRPDFWKKVLDFIVWETCDLSYTLDIPLHIHSGNGEGQDKLSTHYPYRLENVIRYPVEYPQKPLQVVLLHAGYPHHGEAAYLTHVFPNAWFDMSLMAPFINRGLHQRMLEVFEIAPFNKIMYGSDAYKVPELFYLGAVWGKRYIGSALATLVEEKILTIDAAVRYARMILADNAKRLHKIGR